jgi:ketosteroid isomerase-like protein
VTFMTGASRVALGRAVTSFLLLLLAVACSFERRAETEVIDDPSAGDVGSDPAARSGEDSVLGVVDAYHRALGSGDAARLAQLVGPDALLVDQEEGVLWSPRSAGPLPSALVAPGEGATGGLAWERVGTRVDAVGPTRLVILRYRATVAGEAVPWWGVESLLLEPGPAGGWQIHFAHRSRGPGGSGELR